MVFLYTHTTRLTIIIRVYPTNTNNNNNSNTFTNNNQRVARYEATAKTHKHARTLLFTAH